MKLVNALLYFILVSGPACRTVATQKPSDSERYVVMGSYGGFTGGMEKTTYRGDGSVWVRQDPGNRDSMVRKLTPGETEFLFNALETVDFSKLPPFIPGNMNYFLEYRKDSGPVSKFQWSGQLDTTQAEVRKLYPVLNRFLGI